MLFPLFATQSVTVSWDANRESDLSGYRVYYGTRSADYNEQISVGNVTSFRVSGLEEGRRYYFAVTAVDVSGNESGFSNEASIETPPSAPGDPPGDPPDDGLPEDPPANPNAEAIATLVYNFPNPFRVGRESTTIRYELLDGGEITIDILDVDNKVVRSLLRNGFRQAGENVQDSWDGRNANGDFVANGVYFCRVRLGNLQRFIKVAVIR